MENIDPVDMDWKCDYRSWLNLNYFFRYLVAVLLAFFSLPAFSSETEIALTVKERSGIDRLGEPVTCGVPLPEGRFSEVGKLSLLLDEVPIPVEVRPVDYWPDGSLAWVHLDFRVSVEAGKEKKLILKQHEWKRPDSHLEVVTKQDAYIISTGKVRVEVVSSGFNVFNSIRPVNADGSYGPAILEHHKRGLVLNAGGTEYVSAYDRDARIMIESSGEQRVVLKAEGKLKSANGDGLLNFICRMYFYNNSPVVRLAYTFENRDQEETNKVVVENLKVELPLSLGDATRQFLVGNPEGDLTGEFESNKTNVSVTVDSSTIYRFAGAVLAIKGGNPRLSKPDDLGWIASSGGHGTIALGVRDFWQTWPSSLEISNSGELLTAGLLDNPKHKPLDIYSGVARTHYLRLAFLPVNSDTEEIRSLVVACQKPLIAQCWPEYYCRVSRAFGKINERNGSLYPNEHRRVVLETEAKLDLGLEKMLQAVDLRTRHGVTRDSYGYLEWGDGLHYAWQKGVSAMANLAWNGNYYDLPHMSCLEWLRSGDFRFYDYFLSRSHHLMDVHITHFEPSFWGNGSNRYCPPTDHVRKDPSDNNYKSAEVHIHRYQSHSKVQSLFERYLLTGDERALDVALKVVERSNSFGAYDDWKQPRSPAHQVIILVEGYKFTGDERFLNTARRTFETWYNYFESTDTKFVNLYFQVGFLLEAFIDYYEVTQDERVIDFIRQAVDWMKTHRPNDKFSNMALGIGFLAAELNDPEYTILQKEYLASYKGVYENVFKDYAMYGRNLARALYYLSNEALYVGKVE